MSQQAQQACITRHTACCVSAGRRLDHLLCCFVPAAVGSTIEPFMAKSSPDRNKCAFRSASGEGSSSILLTASVTCPTQEIRSSTQSLFRTPTSHSMVVLLMFASSGTETEGTGAALALAFAPPRVLLFLAAGLVFSLLGPLRLLDPFLEAPVVTTLPVMSVNRRWTCAFLFAVSNTQLSEPPADSRSGTWARARASREWREGGRERAAQVQQ